MTDPLKKVQTGSPLKIPAAAYNTFIDLAREMKQRRHAQMRSGDGSHASAGSPGEGTVLVKNISGQDRDRFAAMAIAGPIITPGQNETAFRNRIAVTGEMPGSEVEPGNFVILLEPLRAGAIGRAMAMGICPARVQVQDANHRCADLDTSGDGLLHSTELGPAHILWKESGTGTRWALLRLGSPGPQVLEDLVDVATPQVATGDILFRDGTGHWHNLAIGSGGYVLTVSGGLPAWAEPPSGGGGGDPVTGASPWLNRIGDTMHHTGPGITTTSTSIVTDVRTQDDMTGWHCGRIRIYRRPLNLDARGHASLGSQSDDWADVYYD